MTNLVTDQAVAYRRNGQGVSAQSFYAIACEPKRNVAIEACAGAGKTWMLVSRIVRALLDGFDPVAGMDKLSADEILAITFTKRSAGEMRERLNDWLDVFAKADQASLLEELKIRGVAIPDDPVHQARLTTALSSLFESLLAGGRQVQIRTFHSWFAAILRSAPIAVLQQLGLPQVYDLLEDDKGAKAQVWRPFYRSLVGNADLLADFTDLVHEHGRFQADKALRTALDKRAEFDLADARGVVERSVVHFSKQFPEFAGFARVDDWLLADDSNWKILQAAAIALGQAKAVTYSAKGRELEMALTAKDLDGAFAALLTKEGTARKFGDKIVNLAHVRAAQDLVLRVVAGRHQHTAWLHQQRMARLSRALIAAYGQLKRSRGWVDMNDVERAARVMLGDPVLSGWVQVRLDARIRHLLIDEFQDTNPLQWQALSAWLGSYAGSGAGSAPSVFLVGDPKQSIYRFRRAEPQVFKAAQTFVQNGLNGALLECDHTRRNARQVIATVNAVMVQAQQSGEFEGFREHTSSATEAGCVCKLPPIPRDAVDAGARADLQPGEWRDSLTQPQKVPEETLRTLEARQAAQWIALQIDGGCLPQEVMVLARQRASLAPMKDELQKLGIAAQIGEKTALYDCCEVQDVVALLDVLVSPQHDLSLARVLKSPLFDLDDQALVQLAVRQRVQAEPWFDLLGQMPQFDSIAPAKPEAKDGEAPRSLSQTLKRWKAWVDQLPPHDALQAIFDDGDVLARYAVRTAAAQRDAVLSNLRMVLAVSLQLNGGRFSTPYGLVRALKSADVKAPPAVVATAVRLLTVHGAKGLEADAVLLLDTDANERNADSMGVLVDWPGESAEPVKFAFLVSENDPPACAIDELAFELAQRQREEINALYVAMTRARKTLAISSIEPSRPSGRSWWARLTAVDWVGAAQMHTAGANPLYDAPAKAVPAAMQTGKSMTFQLQVLPVLRVKAEGLAVAHVPLLASNEFQQLPDTLDSLAARQGQAMHKLLEWGDLNLQNLAAVRREYDLDAQQMQIALDMANRILNGAGAWCWQSDQLNWQGDEVELIVGGETLRLDRLVQRKDSLDWWVLDYKSKARPQQDSALVAQLTRYCDAVQSIYPQQLVKAAFLTGNGELVML